MENRDELKLQGYDNYLRAVTSIPAIQRKPVGLGLPRMESQYGPVSASSVGIGRAIRRATGSPGTADFSTGPALNLTSTITFLPPRSEQVVFGIPLISVYQGTTLTAANRIYPQRGANVTLGRYTAGGDCDKLNFTGTALTWRGQITDSNGTSTQVISFDADWLYLDYGQEVG